MDTEIKPKTEHSFLFHVIKYKFHLLCFLFLLLLVFPVFTGGTFYWDKFLNKLFSPRIVETAYVKGVPVHISNDAYLTKNDVRQWIKTQPDLLLQSTSNIYICDFSKDNVCSQNVDTSYDGGHVEETNSIYLDSNSHDLNYEMTDEMFRLFIDKYDLWDSYTIENMYQYWNENINSDYEDSDDFLLNVGKQYLSQPNSFKTEAELNVKNDFSKLFQRASGEANIKGIPVYQEGNVNISQKTLENIGESHPDALLQRCRAIYVCDPTIETTCSKRNAGFSEYASFIDSMNGIIYINDEYSIDRSVTWALMCNYTNQYGLYYQQNAINLYNQYTNLGTDTPSRDVTDFLGRSAKMYFNRPEDLKTDELMPVYNYFQSLFHFYQE